MSICGTLVSLEWSRLAVFKEVTTTVWQLMARFFVFFFPLLAEKKQIYQNTFEIQKKRKEKKRRNVSFLCTPDAHTRTFYVYVCVCVLKMRHRVGRSYGMD